MTKKVYGFRELLAFSVIGFLAGVILGFLFAPVKRGMTIGSYNGNRVADKDDNDKMQEMQEDLAMEMGELR